MQKGVFITWRSLYVGRIPYNSTVKDVHVEKEMHSVYPASGTNFFTKTDDQQYRRKADGSKETISYRFTRQNRQKNPCRICK